MSKPRALATRLISHCPKPSCYQLPVSHLRQTLGRRYAHNQQKLVKAAIEASTRSKPGRETSFTGMSRSAIGHITNSLNFPLLPGTFVPSPMSQYPRKPMQFLKYQYWRTTMWIKQLLQYYITKFQTMPTFTKAPRLKGKRSQIAPTAKAMHQEMLEAFAAGDSSAIKRLCTESYASRLERAITRRNPEEQTCFSILKYHQPWFYPQLVSHNITPVEFNPHLLLEQAVVAIASLQKVYKVGKATQKVVPGSTKLQRKLEYVVTHRVIDKRTYECGQWVLFGTVTPHSYDIWLKERDVAPQAMLDRAGWSSKKESSSS